MFARAIRSTTLVQLRRPLRIALPTRQVGSDARGIPLRPTWSVKELLSSYPSPSISPDKFKRLHQLSALIPPAEGTPEYDTMKKELDELIKLVEAVKLVDIEATADDSIPDGRIWAVGTGIPLADHGAKDAVWGSELLSHASTVVEDMYVIETERER